MQGAGNDFVMIDNRHSGHPLINLRKWCPTLCDRRFGIGADGIISLQNDPGTENCDFEMVYLNADGSDAGMCGNGGRCIARFAYASGLSKEMTFRVHDELYNAKVLDDYRVELQFPMSVKVPRLFDVNQHSIYSLKPGTEHAVCLISEEQLKDRDQLYPLARSIKSRKDLFPAGTNVNFVADNFENISGEIQIETYERGVEDFTYACGTGAIASAISAHQRGSFSKPDQAHPKRWCVSCAGGQLEVSFDYDPDAQIYHNISLKGPAEFVFKGEIQL